MASFPRVGTTPVSDMSSNGVLKLATPWQTWVAITMGAIRGWEPQILVAGSEWVEALNQVVKIKNFGARGLRVSTPAHLGLRCSSGEGRGCGSGSMSFTS